MYRDPASYALFAGGWASKIVKLMKMIRPDATSPILKDEKLMELMC